MCLNAGIVGGALGPPWQTDPDAWDETIRANLGGVVNGLRAFVPRLLASGQPGHVLITASLAGLASFAGGGAYAASKHAVVAVAEQTALSLAGTPVGVTVLCPARVRTGLSPVGADPGDVAAEALAAVREGRFAVVPAEWRDAVARRAEHLVSGAPPEQPAPVRTGHPT